MTSPKSTRERIAQTMIETGMAETPPEKFIVVEVDDYVVVVEWDGDGEPTAQHEHRDGLDLVHVDFPEAAPGTYHLSVQLPFKDLYRTWTGEMNCWKGIELSSVGMNYSFDTAVNRALPIICNYSRTGENRHVVSLQDHRPLTHVHQRMFFPMRPPLQRMLARFSRRRDAGSFRETVIINQQTDHWDKAVRDVISFCREAQQIPQMPTPAWGFEPVWCSWYSHIYGLTQQDMVDHIPMLKELGFRTVIIDASWFKDRLVGMANAWGDWRMKEQWFPDFPALADQLHEAGLKVLLWCSPAFIGKLAECREEMEPYRTLGPEGKRHDLLCPFCEESHQHAREVALRVMREYKLDGLKVDFMDRIEPQCHDPEHDHGDGNFGAAMERMMQTIRDAIVEVKADAVIEYRISYSTLASQPYANCHRANDAPFEVDYMRRENLFLRLFVDHPQAVWNDYAYWHQEESLANVELMLCMQIFSGGVPTVSVDLTQISAEERALIKRWLAFYNQHRESLAKAVPVIHSADSSLSLASLQHEPAGIAFLTIGGQHIPARVELAPGITTVWVLNASAELNGSLTLQAGDRTATADLNGQGPVEVAL